MGRSYRSHDQFQISIYLCEDNPAASVASGSDERYVMIEDYPMGVGLRDGDPDKP